MKKLKLKICGMKDNTAAVAALKPDYLGFIFYEGSPRNYTKETITYQPYSLKKVGVFVDASIEFILEKIEKHKLHVIQLHGDENPHYCASLRTAISKELERPSGAQLNQDEYRMSPTNIWKVFSIKDCFDFSVLKEYKNEVDAFLFDTKGVSKGGNGITFNWKVLKDYPGKKPFILSGGIGLEELSDIKELLTYDLPIMAVDVNSKFEDAPGLKNIQKLKEFKEQLSII
jgi:phosphoribosylanthranilate isomerase